MSLTLAAGQTRLVVEHLAELDRVLREGLHVTAGAASLVLLSLQLLQSLPLLLLPPLDVLRRDDTSVLSRVIFLQCLLSLLSVSSVSQTPHVGIKESLIATLAVELSVVLVEAGGVEGLAAGPALDAHLVEGSSVHGHHRLGRVDGGLAGGAPGGCGGSRPTHPATTTTTTVREREREGAC